LSVDALHDKLIREEDAAVPARLVGTLGAVMSPPDVACTVNVALPVILLESRAMTVMMLSPDFRSMASIFQVVVPIPIPEPPRSLVQVTAFTVFPFEAEAVPARFTMAPVVVVEPVLVGVVIVTVGAVRLAPVGTFQKQSFRVVMPPPVAEPVPVAQLGLVAMARKRVEPAEFGTLSTDQLLVPVASA
jgi:hypothetical protein